MATKNQLHVGSLATKRIAVALAALVAVALAGPAASPARAGVIFFSNDPGGFSSAMVAAEAKSLGVETFEQSTLAAASDSFFPNPLTQGVANGPFPAGLNLPMTIQSNLLGFVPPITPSPSAPGLQTTSAGRDGAVSDVVTRASFNDSLDVIFSALDLIAGVGFNPISLLVATTIDVTVFDTNNVLLGSVMIAADPAGTNFLGIQATGGDLIGRVNVFAALNTESGIDNVELYTIPEPGTVALFGIGLLALGVAARRRKAG